MANVVGNAAITGTSLTSSDMVISGFVKNSASGLLSGGNKIKLGDVGSIFSASNPITYNSSTGAIGFDNPGYITGNQTITLGGILSGSGATSINTSASTGYYMPLTTDQTSWNTAYNNASQALGTGSTPTFAGLSLVSGGALKTSTNANSNLFLSAYNTGTSQYINFATLTSGTSPTLNLASGVTINGNTIINGSLANQANGYLGLSSTGNFDASLGTVLFNWDIYSQNIITWQHPRDPSELNGGSNFGPSSAAAFMGMYEQLSTTDNISVSKILANVWCTNASRNIAFKLFITNSVPTGSNGFSGFNPDTATPLYSGTINSSNMPHTSNAAGSLFTLTAPVTVPAGQYLFVIWEDTNVSELAMHYFNSNSSSAPYRHPFIYGLTNAAIIFSSTSLNYYAQTFRVYGTVDLTIQYGYNGSNLISNPGFETGVWGTTPGGTAGVDETTSVHSGSYAEELVSTNTNWYTPQALKTIAVTGGQQYQLSFWTRGDGTNDGVYAVYDVTHSAYITAGPSGVHTGINGTTWTQYTTTFTTPAGCTSVQLYLAVTQGSGATAYFDDISLIQYASTPTPLSVQTLFNNLPSNAITFADPNGIMTSTNVQAAIVEAYNHAGTSTLVSPRIVLPDTLYAVVGDELQLFVRGMIEAQNPYNLPYVIDSNVGNSYPRYFDYTPVSGDVGTHTLTVKVLNYDYSVLTTASANLKVVNANHQPAAAKNILIVGDSLSGGGTWEAELYRRLTQSGGTPAGLGYSNINFIGDIALPGYTTQGYDAWGGWTYSLYTDTTNTGGHLLTGTFDKDSTDAGSIYTDGTNQWTIIYAKSGNILKVGTGVGSPTFAASGTLTWVSGGTHHTNIVYTAATNEPVSPFWDSAGSKFDFTAFTSRVGASGIDAVYVLLSWNNIFTPNMTTFSYLTQTQTFLNQLHTDYPNAVVRLMGVQIPSVNGGLGTNYGSAGSAEYYGMVRTVNNNNIALQQLADQSAYSSWVSFIGTAPQFDSENNMSQSATAVNTRNPATEQRGTNGVHPATYGYYQIADMVFREFINTFCQ